MIPGPSDSAEHTRDRLNWSNYMRFVLNELGLEKDAFTYREYAVMLYNEASAVELPFTPGRYRQPLRTLHLWNEGNITDRDLWLLATQLQERR